MNVGLRWLAWVVVMAVGCTPPPANPAPRPVETPGSPIRRLDGTFTHRAEIEATVARLMAAARVPGVAVAIVNDGYVAYVGAHGFRDVASQQRMTVDTAMVGASFTKAAFAMMVLQLVRTARSPTRYAEGVSRRISEARDGRKEMSRGWPKLGQPLVDEGRLDLDQPIEHYLGSAIGELDKYRDLAGDDRTRRITARMLLSHTSGLPNWRRFNDDGKLDIKFEPGARYSYSGEGIALLQLVIQRIAGQSMTELMAERVFGPLGMSRTSMVWRPEFSANHATRYDSDGKPFPPSRRMSPDAAGSMTTTIRDWASLLAALQDGRGMPATAREEMLRPQVRIRSKYQFPVGSAEISHDHDAIQLSYGLGWGLFFSPYGKAFFKEGHDDGAQNYCVAFPDAKIAVVIMTNSDNGESIFQELLAALIADRFTPASWNRYTPYQERAARR